MKKIEPFDFVSRLLEMDLSVLSEILGTPLSSHNEIFKRFSYNEALELYNCWRECKN